MKNKNWAKGEYRFWQGNNELRKERREAQKRSTFTLGRGVFLQNRGKKRVQLNSLDDALGMGRREKTPFSFKGVDDGQKKGNG